MLLASGRVVERLHADRAALSQTGIFRISASEVRPAFARLCTLIPRLRTLIPRLHTLIPRFRTLIPRLHTLKQAWRDCAPLVSVVLSGGFVSFRAQADLLRVIQQFNAKADVAFTESDSPFLVAHLLKART